MLHWLPGRQVGPAGTPKSHGVPQWPLSRLPVDSLPNLAIEITRTCPQTARWLQDLHLELDKVSVRTASHHEQW